jgi:glycosyltransferase involved in cell wall biosynthesis
MKLGIDAKALVGRKTGIGNWTALLLQELPAHIPDLEVFAYVPSSHTPSIPEEIAKACVRQNPAFPLMSGFFWLKFRAAELVKKDNLDVFWAARTLCPRGIKEQTPVVSTIYDLNSVLYPETMSLANLIAYKLWFRADLQKSDRIVAISQGTSARLESWMGRAADFIVPPGVAEHYAPQPPTVIDATLRKYGLNEPYLLFVGTLEPRKNLSALLDALEIINAARAKPITLAIIGQRGWRNKELFKRLDSGIPFVTELGFVPGADLPALYSGAASLMMPSLYEGYGMPAAEAAACGTWVVATDIPELREAAGGSGIYIEPSVQGIVTGIERALSETSPPVPFNPVSWRDSAARLAEALQEAAGSRQHKK